MYPKSLCSTCKVGVTYYYGIISIVILAQRLGDMRRAHVYPLKWSPAYFVFVCVLFFSCEKWFGAFLRLPEGFLEDSGKVKTDASESGRQPCSGHRMCAERCVHWGDRSSLRSGHAWWPRTTVTLQMASPACPSLRLFLYCLPNSSFHRNDPEDTCTPDSFTDIRRDEIAFQWPFLMFIFLWCQESTFSLPTCHQRLGDVLKSP